MPRKKKTEEEKTEEKKGEKSTEEKNEEKATAEKKSKKEEKAEKERKEKLKKEIEEKAKKLEEKIDKTEEKKIKEEVKESQSKKKSEKVTLFPLDDYVKYSAHLGTKAITPHMRQFVYKRRADGLAVLNTNSIDEKLKEALEFLKNYEPADIFLACKREAGWKAAKKFSEVTGIKVFTKKYPAGMITNTQLEDFFEVELIIICDPWLDKNALNDAGKVKRPVIALCDTNNLTTGVTKVVPCNNKSGKSLGLILYLMAREYLRLKGKEKESVELKLEDFTGFEEEQVVERKEEKKEDKEEKGAKEGV